MTFLYFYIFIQTSNLMKRPDKTIAFVLLTLLIPAVAASAQEKKTEQHIKIVVAGDDGSKVLVDTLITGSTPADSIIVKGGKTIYLSKVASDDPDAAGGSKKYVVTTTVTDKNKQSHCEELVSGGKSTYTVVTDTRDSDSEKAKYVISRDGVQITVEGSDYEKVKEVMKNIEKTLDSK